MNCPRCKGECKTEWYEGVCIDVCTKCEGTWLDNGELKAIAKHHERVFSKSEIDAVRGVTENVIVKKEDLVSELACPKCGAMMTRFNYGEESGVILDKCEQHGIWFDKGELESVEILCDAWEEKAGEDKSKFAPILEKAAKEQRARLQQASPGKWFSASPILNFILDHFD